ncbi:MAG: hypothetical protein FJX74_21930, partial [Armatimonadetes bacterium]|nr:hypothetical protein [Armatimonadota bacterium]
MRELSAHIASVLLVLSGSATVGLPQTWLPLLEPPEPGPDSSPGTITAEFPDGPRAALARDRPASDPVGGTIVITNLFDNRITWDPDDGVISVYEARIYARNDTGPNVLYFHPSFGRVVIKYESFTLPSPEDTFVGRDLVRAPGGTWNDAGTVSGVFLDGVLTVTGQDARIHHCYAGFDWDKTTPLSNVFWPSISVQGNHCRVYDNRFCADPDDGDGGVLSVGGEDNWAYGNVIGLENDLLTPHAMPPRVGLIVSGRRNRIGDRADAANHILASETCIEISGRGHRVRSNAIGRNTGGKTCRYGVELKPSTEVPTRENYIGGPSGQPGLSHNIITNFTEAGVYFGEGCHYNAMGGNLIGLKPNGTLAFPRGKTGVIIGANTVGNEVGGSSSN